MKIENQTWIGRHLHVVDSCDFSLKNRGGVVVDETRETLQIIQGNQKITLGKRAIKFTVDDSKVIDGMLVRQRAEDRIHRNYRMV